MKSFFLGLALSNDLHSRLCGWSSRLYVLSRVRIRSIGEKINVDITGKGSLRLRRPNMNGAKGSLD